jgi:hypothetical protein
VAKRETTSSIGVALSLPTRVADFIVRAQLIHDTMAANAGTVPSPTPPLAVLQTHITTLVTREAAAQARTAGTVTDRNTAWKVVRVDLASERAYVETLVNADPENASTIAQDAGMALRKVGTRNKPLLAAKPGPTSGAVHVVAKATAGAVANEWQYSVDGGKTYVDLPTTSGAATLVQNLTPGVTVLFRQRPVTRKGVGDWSVPVPLVVT